MPHRNPIALHSWTLGARPLSEIVRIAARAGYDAVELNWQDIDRCHGDGLCETDIASIVRKSGLAVAALGVAPGILFAGGAEAAALREGLRRMSGIAGTLGCRLLMTAVGPYEGPAERAVANLAHAGEIAAVSGLRLALEFNFQHRVLHSLDLLLGVVRDCERANCGVVLDSYHLHRGGHPGDSFDQIDSEEIFLVQLSDVPARPSNEPGVPLDRLPPGEGEVRWRAFFECLESKGYSGPVSYEAPNPSLWQRPPDDVAEEGLAAIRRLLTTSHRSGRNPSSG